MKKSFATLVFVLLSTEGTATEKNAFVDVVVLQKHAPTHLFLDSGDCKVEGFPKPILQVSQHKNEVRACGKNGACIENPSLTLRCRSAISLRPDGGSRRHFGNSLIIKKGAKGLRIIAHLPLEPYVREVLKSEISRAPQAALVAQQILIRTYALRAHRYPRHRDADLCDLTHCQVFGARQMLDANAKRGPLLVDQKEDAADVYYHSTCGGTTLDASSVWPGASPQLIGIDDSDEEGKSFCAASPHYRWSTRLSFAELDKVLRSIGHVAKKEFHIGRDKMGLFLREVHDGRRGQRISLSPSRFHRAVGKTLGWHRLKSFDFQVMRTPTAYVFSGRGLGHGVGLCQFGAMERARQGQSAAQILQNYFPNFKLSSNPVPAMTSNGGER